MRVPASVTERSNKGSQTSDCENDSLVVGSPGSHVKSTKGHSESVGGIEKGAGVGTGGEPSCDMTW